MDMTTLGECMVSTHTGRSRLRSHGHDSDRLRFNLSFHEGPPHHTPLHQRTGVLFHPYYSQMERFEKIFIYIQINSFLKKPTAALTANLVSNSTQ